MGSVDAEGPSGLEVGGRAVNPQHYLTGAALHGSTTGHHRSQLQGSCGLAAGLHFYQVGCFAQSELGWVLTSCMEQGSLIPSWHRCSWDFAAPVLLHAPAQVCQVWGAERRLLGAALPWDVLGWAWSRQAAELDALNHAYVCMHVLRRHTLPVCLECH